MPFLGAFALGVVAGLASLPHCLGMCGPFAAFATARSPRPLAGLVQHQLGRALAYAAAGALAGLGGATLARTLLPAWSAHVLSTAIAVAMLANAIRLVRPPRPRDGVLVPLGRPTRLRERFLVHALRARPFPAALGALTVLFPCGALYSALAISVGTGGPAEGALAMLAFALASGPGLALAGWAGTRSLDSQHGRRALALSMVIGALVVALRPLTVHDGAPACHVSPPAASE